MSLIKMKIPAMTVPTGFNPAANPRRRARTAGMLGLLLATAILAGGPRAAAAPAPQSPSELFGGTTVWTVHLQFTPEQWEAMEPPQTEGGPFGGPRGPGGRGGGGFGPAMFLAPAFLAQGDQNRDGKLSREEFQSLGAKWFADWDKKKSGSLSADQLRDGLGGAFAPPNGGPPGPPGVPGRGGRSFLQGEEGKRNGLASSAGVEFKQVHADLEFEGKTIKDVAVRYKGNGTWMQSRGSQKRSFKVDLSQFVKGRTFAGISKLNLHNCVTDASWMNEVMSHRLYRDAGVPAPRSAYARVYVTVPGKHQREYFGLYSIVENIDPHFAGETLKSKKGAIFKPVTPAPFTDLGDDWAKYKQTYDPKTKLSKEQIRRVIDFCKLVSKADDAEFAAKLGGYLDLEEFSRYMAVTVWLSTLDSILTIGQNYYVHLDPNTDKFQFLPWDLDHSFGQFGMGASQEQRDNLSIHHPWRGDIRFLDRVFKVEAFKKLYLAKLGEFSGTIFKPERFNAQVDEIAAAIRPSVKEESAEKLERFNKVAAGESVPPAGFGGPPPGRGGGNPPGGRGGEGPRPGGPGGFGMPPAKPVKAFVSERARSVTGQLAGKIEGQTLDEGSGPGGGGRGGRGRQGGPGGFNPGGFLGGAFLSAMDSNKDESVTREEFTKGFTKWFDAWNADKSGTLTEDQLRAGINADLSPFPGGPPRGGPGGPGGPPPPGR
jgi:hypothetical protein